MAKDGPIETVKVTLFQMLDLALNSGESGLVNFSMIHTIMQIIISQLGLQELPVEFRGDDSKCIKAQLAIPSESPKYQLHSYTVNAGEPIKVDTKATATAAPKVNKENKDPKDTKDTTKDVAKDAKPASPSAKPDLQGGQKPAAPQLDEKLKEIISTQEIAKEKILRVIQRRKSSKEEIPLELEGFSSPTPSAYSIDKVVVVEQAGKPTAEYSLALTRKQFDNFNQEMSDLKKKVQELIEMPTNIGLLNAIKEADVNKAPLLDFFQLVTLNKRIEAAEQSMTKLASMMTDLAKNKMPTMSLPTGKGEEQKIGEIDYTTTTAIEGTTAGMPSTAALKVIEKRLDELEEVCYKKDGGGGSIKGGGGGGGTGGGGGGSIKDKDTSSIKEKKKPKKKSPDNTSESSAEKTSVDGEGLGDGENLSKLPLKQAMGIIQKELLNLKGVLETTDLLRVIKDVELLKELLGGGGGGGQNAAELPPELRLNQIESKFRECQEQMKSLDTMYNHQINTLQNHLHDLQNEMSQLIEKINMGFPSGDHEGNENSIAELYEKMTTIQEDLDNLAEVSQKLSEEKSIRDNTINVLTEQIELLKTVKADREDLEDALNDKADACAVNRKVSHGQFDAACDVLSKGIEEAIAKLTQQELMWQNALDDIQRDIGNKLDKVELMPLRDFINTKLKNLQEKFKALTALKKEQEAAGTKSKFLRNVNCISCDKEVIMRKEMDPSMMPQPVSLPPNRSMGPYLAYELDQLRKQQKSLSRGKNLNFIENALTSKQNKDKDHICNRYCGGSHTITTPQQRVTRLGHFLQQYGPEIVPVADNKLKSQEGFTYNAKEAATEPEADAVDKGVNTGKEVVDTKKIGKKTDKRPATVASGSSTVLPADNLSGPKRASLTNIPKKASFHKPGSSTNVQIQDKKASITSTQKDTTNEVDKPASMTNIQKDAGGNNRTPSQIQIEESVDVAEEPVKDTEE